MVIQGVSLMKLGGSADMRQDGDCKIYTPVSLQLCKLTDDQMDANCGG
jgi:hypothetical protein